MKTKFEVKGKIFEIEYSIFGHERYLYDGEVIRTGWSIKTQATEIFDIGDDEIKIENKVSFSEPNCRAYFNGELIVDDLFPELTKKLQNRKKNSLKKTLAIMAFSCVLTMFLISIYNTYR
ncbi:hypothetical protein ACWU4D_00025 [Vibrio sp. WJH972]